MPLPETWVLLGLGCALGTAAADVLTKRSAPRRSHAEALLLRTLLPALLLLPLLSWTGLPRLDAASLPWLAAALPLEVLALHWYLGAIRGGLLAQTLPFLALTPVASIGAAHLLLGERVNPVGAAGILLIGAGCYFASRMDAAAPGEDAAGAGRRARRRAMARMAGVALVYALTPVLAKGAMRDGPPLAFGIAYYSAVAALTAALILPGGPDSWRRALQPAAADWAIGLCIAAVVLMHYAALQLAPVPYFIALKRLSIFFGAILGAFVLKEAAGRGGWQPAALVVLGAAFIVLR